MRFTLSLLLILSLLSCTSDHPKIQQQPQQRQGKTIEYYPKTNIYYDVDRQSYIKFSNEKGEWENLKTLPTDIASTLGKKITLPNPSVPVYKDNAEHRMVYSVSLYNTPDSFRKKFIEDSIAQLPKKIGEPIQKVDSSGDKKRKKRGLRRLLDRIF